MNPEELTADGLAAKARKMIHTEYCQTSEVNAQHATTMALLAIHAELAELTQTIRETRTRPRRWFRRRGA